MAETQDRPAGPRVRAGAPARAEESDSDGEFEGEDNGRPVPLWRRPVVVAVVGLAFIAIVAAVWYWYASTRGVVTTDDAAVEANRATVSSKLLGRIDSLTVDEGDTVRVGELIARLDARDLATQLAQARASFTLAQENVGLARVTRERAEDDFRRAEQQYRDRVIPKEQFDHARSDLESARTRASIADAQVNVARAQVGVVEGQMSNATILSPLDGVVSRRWVLPGDVVQAGQPIVTVFDTKHVWITANIEETKVAGLAPGNTVEVAVDAYPDRTFSGRVQRLGTSTAAQFSLIPPNNASGNFTKVTQRIPVRIAVEPLAGAPLLPGMSVEVRIHLR